MSLKKAKQKRDYKKITKYALLFLVIFVLSVFFFYVSKNRQEIIATIKSTFASEQDEGDVSGARIEINAPTQICISEDISEVLRVKIEENVSDSITVAKGYDENLCAIHLTRAISDSNKYNSIWTKLYVPVVRYDDPLNNLTKDELVDGVKSQFSDSYGYTWSRQDSPFINAKFDVEIDQIFPSPEEVVKNVEEKKGVVGIIPLKYLTPKVKIVSVEGVYPFDQDLSIYNYPLSDIIWISKDSNNGDNLVIAANKIEKEVKNWEVEEQYDQYTFDYVILTGKSAVGAQEYFNKFEENPNFNPLSSLSSTIEGASLSHLSNNSSFSKFCVQEEGTNLYCGSPEAIKWLQSSGIDLVGLTGDHIMDYDRNEFRKTLDLYTNSNIRYFGGGETRDEAETPVTKTVGNTQLSFLGYSLLTPTKYIATNRLAGNLAADLTYPGDAKALVDGLKSVPAETDLTIVEMSWGDEESRGVSVAEQEYAQLAAKYGADIVIGTTSNRIKDIEYIGDTLVMYGLGNFLYHDGGKRDNEGLMVKLLFYKGEYVGYLLIPIIIDDDLETTVADVDKTAKILNTVY